MRTKRLDAGLYEITAAGRTWRAESLERHSEGEASGTWILSEIRTGELDGYWNSFATLRDCKAAILEGIEAGD